MKSFAKLPFFVLLLAFLALYISPICADGRSTFSFYVMGNVPFAEEEEEILSSQLRDLRASGADDDLFVVHLGDISNATRSECSAEGYARVFQIFLQLSPLPVLMTPGDDDWSNCPSPVRAWTSWTHYFLNPPMEQNWKSVSAIPEKVERQSARMENFAFVHEGVLFLGLNLVAGTSNGNIPEEEWERRLDENIEWTDRQLARHNVGGADFASDSRTSREAIRAIIVFGHSNQGSRVLDNLFNRLQSASPPVLFIHGDGRKWGMDQPYAKKGWDNYWSVQVDRGAIAPPLKVTVRSDASSESNLPWGAENADQFVCGDSIKLDRRKGGTVGPMPTPSSADGPSGTTAVPPQSQPVEPTAPASFPTNGPSSSSPLHLDASILLELRLMHSIMDADVELAFETTCEFYLSELFQYTAPPVFEIGCQVQSQMPVEVSMPRIAGNENEVKNVVAAEGGEVQANIALQVQLHISGELARSGPSSSDDEKYDFEQTVVDFFIVMNTQFVALLKDVSDGTGVEYFSSVSSVKVIKQNEVPAGEQTARSSGGGGGNILYDGLGLSLLIVGLFVVVTLLVGWIFYQRKRSLARRYGDIADAESRPSRKSKVRSLPKGSNATPPPSPDEPPSVINKESDEGSMSRLQDFESACDSYAWCSIGAVGNDDRSGLSSPRGEDDARRRLQRTESGNVTAVSFPTLPSGAPPSLAPSDSEASPGCSPPTRRDTTCSATSVASPSGPSLSPFPASVASPSVSSGCSRSLSTFDPPSSAASASVGTVSVSSAKGKAPTSAALKRGGNRSDRANQRPGAEQVNWSNWLERMISDTLGKDMLAEDSSAVDESSLWGDAAEEMADAAKGAAGRRRAVARRVVSGAAGRGRMGLFRFGRGEAA